MMKKARWGLIASKSTRDALMSQQCGLSPPPGVRREEHIEEGPRVSGGRVRERPTARRLLKKRP